MHAARDDQARGFTMKHRISRERQDATVVVAGFLLHHCRLSLAPSTVREPPRAQHRANSVINKHSRRSPTHHPTRRTMQCRDLDAGNNDATPKQSTTRSGLSCSIPQVSPMTNIISRLCCLLWGLVGARNSLSHLHTMMMGANMLRSICKCWGARAASESDSPKYGEITQQRNKNHQSNTDRRVLHRRQSTVCPRYGRIGSVLLATTRVVLLVVSPSIIVR